MAQHVGARPPEPQERSLAARGQHGNAKTQAAAIRCGALQLAQVLEHARRRGPRVELGYTPGGVACDARLVTRQLDDHAQRVLAGPFPRGMHQGDARRRSARGSERAGARRARLERGGLEQRDALRPRTQPDPRRLDHAERSQGTRVELVQVVARHVLHDATAAVRARPVRERNLEPQHAVARPAETLGTRSEGRGRQRTPQRRRRARRVERQLPACRRDAGLDLGERGPRARVANALARIEYIDPRERRGREQHPRAPRQVPELESASAATNHTRERQLREGCEHRRERFGVRRHKARRERLAVDENALVLAHAFRAERVAQRAQRGRRDHDPNGTRS